MSDKYKGRIEFLQKAIQDAMTLEERAELEDELEDLQRKYLNED